MADEALPGQQDETQAPNAPEAQPEPGAALHGWIMERVRKWRDMRDQRHRKKWDEYIRIWRGEWSEEDKNRKSERSKIITPATMQAVDSTVAEIDEAFLGREQWFDINDDLDEIQDSAEKQEIIDARDRLRELADEEKIPDALAKIFLIGTLYGTGIGKINTYVKSIPSLVNRPDGTRAIVNRDEVRVELIPLEPYDFVPDPTTDDIDQMLGAAHETITPIHVIEEGMASGLYRNTSLSTWNPTANDPDSGAGRLFTFDGPITEGVKITEWHGKVPAAYLASYLEPDDEFVKEMADRAPEHEMVEAIVTIANESKVIGAKANPFLMKDRCFIAYQHDTIPGYFWGRGVPEKAYNPQKALDADIRGRIDSIALTANPMVAGDITRLPRGMNLAVWPGKFWPTTGAPKETLMPFQFGHVSPELFANSADMERMVQTATGAMDPGASYAEASGPTDRGMLGSSFIKRSRRTVQNIERNLMQPLVRKTMWRYVQFSPQFPQDFKFVVRGTLGMMAREIEAQQLTQTLSLVPNDSKPFMAILKAALDNNSTTHKSEINKSIDEWLNPSDEQKAMQDFMLKQQQRRMEAETAEIEAKAAESQGKAREAAAKAMLAEAQARAIPAEIAISLQEASNDRREVEEFARQNDISEEGGGLKAIDLALRAAKLPAEIDELRASASKLRADANKPPPSR